MARAPEAGKVKTRMQSALSPEQCAGLYGAFLGDAIDVSLSLEGMAHFLAYMPIESKSAFERMVPVGMKFIPQIGTNLGAVMNGLMGSLFAKKYSPVVLVGSDIPTLQPATVRQALSALKFNDVCLGPSSDGGYYLIGANKPVNALFQDIPWSTSRVLGLTLEKAALEGLKIALLEELADVDTAEELKSLEIEILRLRGQHGGSIPVRTESWVKRNGRIFRTL
jgi:rSAM/selenodomain-associated transferase 1